MLTRREAISKVEHALETAASSLDGVTFFPRYLPVKGSQKSIYLVNSYKAEPQARETFGQVRKIAVDYTFTVGIEVVYESNIPEAQSRAESDLDAILNLVEANLLADAQIKISNIDFYVGKSERGSAAFAGMEVKVSDFS